jgi:hypothetical protein
MTSLSSYFANDPFIDLIISIDKANEWLENEMEEC